MKFTDITKFWKKNKKPLLVAIGVIVIVIVAWILYKKLNRKAKKTMIEDLTGDTLTPGLNFDDLAQRVFMAWISTFGTDEDEVYSVLEQLNNQADWEYLKIKYEEYWDSLPVYEQLIHTTAGLGLTGVLLTDFRREFNKSELQYCRDILTRKNIEPGF